jgi:hypothetical protein
MDSELRNILAQCISDMDRGTGVEDCLKRHPARAQDMRPHLEAWRALSGVSLKQPPSASFDRGRQVMFAALTTGSHTTRPLSPLRLAPAWATVAGGIVAAVLLLGGAAGTSAALGGPDVAGDVFDAVGVTGGGGIGQSSASERGLECANPNAFEGSLNSEDKGQNAEEAKAKQPCSEDECASDAGVEGQCPEGDASDATGEAAGDGNGEDKSENGIDNAPDAAENGKEHANPNAAEGSGNAEDGSENANGNGPGNPANAEAGGQGNNGQGQGGGNDGGND